VQGTEELSSSRVHVFICPRSLVVLPGFYNCFATLKLYFRCTLHGTQQKLLVFSVLSLFFETLRYLLSAGIGSKFLIKMGESTHFHVGFVGAGIGGLAAAIAIAQAGAKVTVLESAEELGEVCHLPYIS
jgi:hypothetical protein